MKTQTKHTPGPWKKSNISAHIYGPQNEYLAICEDPLNARLIAAAPDLLDLLYLALPYVEDAENDPCFKKDVVSRLAKNIRSAIAKAEGETT
jgi:hypothetical protein